MKDIYFYYFTVINIILLLSIEIKKSYLNGIKNKKKLFLEHFYFLNH